MRVEFIAATPTVVGADFESSWNHVEAVMDYGDIDMVDCR